MICAMQKTNGMRTFWNEIFLLKKTLVLYNVNNEYAAFSSNEGCLKHFSYLFGRSSSVSDALTLTHVLGALEVLSFWLLSVKGTGWVPSAQKDAVRLVRNITGLPLAQHNLLGVERVSCWKQKSSCIPAGSSFQFWGCRFDLALRWFSTLSNDVVVIR